MAVSELDELVSEAGAALANCDAGALTAPQHASLLRWLVDDALDSELVRSLLASRETAQEKLMMGWRGELADARASLKEVKEKLRELQEGDKVADKAAKKKKLAAGQAAAAAVAGGTGGGGGPESGGAPEGDQGPPPAKKAKKKSGGGAATEEGGAHPEAGGKAAAGGGGGKGAKTGGGGGSGKAADGESAAGNGAAVEPDDEFALPMELREYKGDPNDKKALAKVCWRASNR